MKIARWTAIWLVLGALAYLAVLDLSFTPEQKQGRASELFGRLTHQPTADERYGCTVAQQAPNGECQ